MRSLNSDRQAEHSPEVAVRSSSDMTRCGVSITARPRDPRLIRAESAFCSGLYNEADKTEKLQWPRRGVEPNRRDFRLLL
jgi:hypothetical protein